MTYHEFEFGDEEVFRWTHVYPGDVVVSPGAIAYKAKDFIGRNDKTRILQLRFRHLLVLSRVDGVPGEEGPEGGMRTFVCLSRHGIIILVQNARPREAD